MAPNMLDLGFAALGLYLVKRILTPGNRNPPLPPGPKGLPLVGNAADMPAEQEWKTFAQWGDIYGPFHPSRFMVSLTINPLHR
jgi:hypothetical protein